MPSSLNSSERPEAGQNEDEPSQGPNLVLFYSLIALALAVAVALAAWIVLPFYLRR
jgi:hypothetical protein